MFSCIRRGLYMTIVCVLSTTAYSQNIGDTVKRILFLGNSITYAGGYVNDVEAYLRVHFPGRHFEIINAGLPSETVSGISEPGHAGGSFPRPDLHERLTRVLLQTRPDMVFACYGMNDGIYMPFDEERFRKFREGITWMHDEIVKSGARLVHITPPVYDQDRSNKVPYEAVLERYSNWLMSLRSAKKWEVIDTHHPMQKYLAAHRKVDASFRLDGFALAQDGIHPGETGHWIIARQILHYLGFKEVMGDAGINANLARTPNGTEILKLVIKRQNMMRDAWLTLTGHKRPGLPVGLPLNEARAISTQLEHEITALAQNKKIAEVYLLGGQSNATGQGYLANMSDTMKINREVLIFHSDTPHLNSGMKPLTWQYMHQASESPDRFGPELGFSSRIRPRLSQALVVIIKHAHSGTSLYKDWHPGMNEHDSTHWGLQFSEFVHVVNAGLDSLRMRGYEPVIRGMLWQQGEAEAFASDSISVQYGVLLRHFITRVRKQFSAPNMAFVYGYVCPPPLTGAGIKTVRQAQHDVDQNSGMALATRNSFVIETDGLSTRANDRNTRYPADRLHFGTDGTWELGVRMAEKMNAEAGGR